ncbi:MAG: hypothetical protein ACLRL4_10230 [Bifidobacterium bifidum]
MPPDKPWTTCRKLGAYLMNGLDDAQVRDMAFTAARWLIGDDAVAYDPEPDGVVAWKVEQAKSKTFTYRNAEGQSRWSRSAPRRKAISAPAHGGCSPSRWTRFVSSAAAYPCLRARSN